MIKRPEFEDRPAIAETNPDDHFPPGARYTLAFRLASVVAGISVLLAFGLSPSSSAPRSLDDLPMHGAGIFYVLVYACLQIACACQQRYDPQTRRARTYLRLLAFLPLWGLPVGFILSTLIIQSALYAARNF